MIPFNRDWLFFRGDIYSPGQTGFTKAGRWSQNGASAELNDKNWQRVALPHDFMFESEFSKAPADQICNVDLPDMGTIDSVHSTRGSIAGGVAWYRKHFHAPENSKGKKVYLRFDGVCRDATVYVNQYRVTSHLNGFMDFSADISDLLTYEGENVVAVRVDTTETEGWWYQGGGIYRNVWLDVRENVHFAYRTLHVIPTVDLENQTGEVKVAFEIENHSEKTKRCKVFAHIYSPDDVLVNENSCTVEVPNVDKATGKMCFQLDNIKLWSCERPDLYRIVLSLYDDTTECIDTEECNFGFRHLAFDKGKGFFLNGVHTKLKGVCVHQGHACVGSAEFDGLHDFKIKKLKAMGCNAYRTSHHPVSRELLDTCDRLGMLVLDETRLLSTGDEDRAIFEQMIKNDRNHPCVIMWSIGNEESKTQFTEQARYICHTMTSIAHKLDPTRPTTEALLFWDAEKGRLRTDVEVAATVVDNVDVLGINYGLSNWQKLHETFSEKPFLGTETATINSTRATAVRNNALCRIPLGYDIAKGENTWRQVAQSDYCMGMFAWTGFDYYGEPTPFTYPAVIGAFGIMDACGFPKYPYYYYRANWRSDVDTFELCPHWNFVSGGEERTVYLFSKCDEAELFVNGVSQGRKKIEKYSHAEWNVRYEPGEITAIGYKDGAETNKKTVVTTGVAVKLQAQTEHLSVDKNGFVWAIITLSAVDDAGHVVPTAENTVQISLGDGVTLAGAGNGNPICHENSKSASHSLFGGLAQVIIKRDVSTGGGFATFSIEGMNEVTVEM